VVVLFIKTTLLLCRATPTLSLLARLALLCLIIMVLLVARLVLTLRLLLTVVAVLATLLPVLVEHIRAAMAAETAVKVGLLLQVAHLVAAVLAGIRAMVEKVQVLLMAHQLLDLAVAVAVAEKLAEHLDGLALAAVA
jgi:hypothetical protein